MLPRIVRDTGALELGFLSDGVLRGVKAVAAHNATSADLDTLRQAAVMMRELASNVGPIGLENERLTLSAAHSFSYAAQALRAVPPAQVRDGLRKLFATIADTLGQLARGEPVEPQPRALVDGFFRNLSEATFRQWSDLGGSASPSQPELA